LFQATINEGTSTPKDGSSRPKPKRRLKRSFLVTPLISEKDNNGTSPDQQQQEATAHLTDMKPLLDFEQLPPNPSNMDDPAEVSRYKERGYQLLRLGDPSTACSFYEMALYCSSILQIGSTVIVKRRGRARLADIDCLDDETGDIDVSMAQDEEEGEEETVVQEKDVLLCILFGDEEQHLQERILLNLARCLLQVADIAKHETLASDRRLRYLKSAILATTLVLVVAGHHKRENDGTGAADLSSLEQTALILRSQAQAGVSKFQSAMADIKRLLGLVPGHKEGQKQMKQLQAQMKRQKEVDKKLIKSMCKLVQTAATDNPVSNNWNDEDASEDGFNKNGAVESTNGDTSNTACSTMTAFISITYHVVVYLILPVLFAYILQDIFS